MSQALPITLGTEPIGKLLRQYAIPAIIAMTASSLYNMVDSIFIGQGVGALAISGLAITFPLMNLAAAFGSLVGVGASTLVSVKLGQKDYQTAQRVLGNVVSLNVIIGLAFSVICLLLLNPILYFFGASEQTIQYAHDYMFIILLGNIVTHLYLGLNAVLRASGHPRSAMYATIATVVLNTILDPLFIFGFGWGIRGAAVATIFSQLVAMLWQLRIFSNKNELLHFHKSSFRLQKRLVFDTISIGLSPFLMNVASCIIVILINNGLKRHGGDLAIGAYGIVNRIAFVFVMIVMGLNQGMQPIAGYNYGAKKTQRVLEILYKTITFATIVTTIGFLLGEFCPRFIIRAFTSDENLIAMTTIGMRIVFVFFPIIGFQMVAGNFFLSIGRAQKSIFLSLTRQVIFLIPSLLVLPHFWGTVGVWASMPLSDFAAAITAFVLLRREINIFKSTNGCESDN